MIKTFRSKSLAALWISGKSPKIDSKMHKRILRRLDALNVAVMVADMDVPGFDLHALKGYDPTRYTVHVNGPWTITFEFNKGNAEQVDFEQYH